MEEFCRLVQSKQYSSKGVGADSILRQPIKEADLETASCKTSANITNQQA